MEPSGMIKHTGPPQPNASRMLRPDAPVFTPQGHCDEPQFGPPQHMHQNPNQPPISVFSYSRAVKKPPTGNVLSYSRAVKKQPENVNYQRNDYQREYFQNIQDERVQPVEPEGVPSINNLPQPDHTNSTTSWHITSIPQQSERQDSQRNDYQKGSFQNNQIEIVQPFEPENIRNVPQTNQTNSTASRAVDNKTNEGQNRQDFSSSEYKGYSTKGIFNKTFQKSARVDESCNLYQQIDGRPQNNSEYQARGHRHRYNTGGRGHSRSRNNYQKENDLRKTSTNNFNKNTADRDDSNNSAAEANTVSGSWDDWEENPKDSTKKFKPKDDNSKWSTGEPQETRSDYGNRHNTHGYKPRDNNYDSRRTSTNNFNKNTADHDDSNNSAAEANTVSDSRDDWEEKPIESTKKIKTKDETSKWSKDFKRDPQETRSGYGNRHNHRGNKHRDNNYDPRRTSTNNSSKYSADRDNSNKSVEHQITPESWEDDDIQSNDIPPKNVPIIDSQGDDVKEHTKPKEERKAKDTKNTDSRQRHEKSPKIVHQDKQATDTREETDENDLAWNEDFSSTPEKSEQTSKQWEHQCNKPKDPRMDREKLNKSESSIFRDESNIDKTVRRSDGNYRSSGVSDKDKDIWDKEFNKWDRTWKQIKDFKIVTEIKGDLFEQPKEYSLAHCVAEDLKMGSGIAVAFKREFKNVPDLLDQRAKQGGLALLPDEKNKRFVYYLVTKRESNGKPTYFTLWKSLCNMKEHIKQNGVKNLAIPRLACGLDRLEWDMVKSMIEYLFTDVDVKITVCNFQQPEQTEEKKSFKCKLVMEGTPITKIDSGTLILYLATAKGDEDLIMKQMSKKFNFLSKFQAHRPKILGDIVYSEDKNWGLCGCIVRNTSSEPISFKSLNKCIQNINRKNKTFGKDAFSYVALQWVDAQQYSDEMVNEKIIMMLRNYLRNVDIHVCTGSFENQ